jgi:hypothetical protein
MQDLAPVGHEQQARVTRTGQGTGMGYELRRQAGVIEGGTTVLLVPVAATTRLRQRPWRQRLAASPS